MRRTAAILGLLLAVSGACGEGSSQTVASDRPSTSTSTTSTIQPDTASDERGYTASPESYLSPEQLAVLRGSEMPVLAPTWLPNWTREVRPDAFLIPGTKGYIITWVAQPTQNSNQSIASRMLQTVSIEVRGERYFPGDKTSAPVAAPTDWLSREGVERTYLWNPDNEKCRMSEPGAGTVAQMQFDLDPKRYYAVELRPGPACSRGEFLPQDMVRFADSLQPID